MTKTQLEVREIARRLGTLGISFEDAVALRRIEMTLQRWHELECGDGNGCIERDEVTGKAYWHHAASGKRWSTPDRERGALKHLAAIMAQYPTLKAYVQGDPRGCALYVGPVAEMTDSTYSRGMGVCV